MIDLDVVRDFIETHRILIIGVLVVVLVILVLILIIGLSLGSSAEKNRKEIEAQRELAAFKLEELFLPLEPIEIPGVILSRPQGKTWKTEDAQRWYHAPEAHEKQFLRSFSQRQIEEILESIP